MEINKIYNENCLDTMAKIPDNFVDLVVTSPPYDNLRTYNGSLEWGEHVWKPIIKELFRTIKEGGVVVWVVGDATIKGSETGTSFKQALYFKEVGFNLHDTMIYAKNNPVPLTHNRYEQQFEYVFILSKGRPRIFNPIKEQCKTTGIYHYRGRGKEYEKTYSVRKREEYTKTKKERIKYNIWFYNVGNNDNTKHNAPFPEQLVNDHIISWSNIRGLVYDPFMGSGTVAKISILNNRNYIGSEIVSEYCQIAEERIALIKKEAPIESN